MPSGKRAKQQRREAAVAVRTPPPVRSKGAPRMAGRRQASPRVLWGAAGVVGLVVIAIVLVVVLSRGSSTGKSSLPINVTPSQAFNSGLPGAQDVYTMLNGIPQHGNILGSPKATATLIEYIDLQCPFCQQFETQLMPSVISRYVRPGKVKVEVRPIAFIGPDSVRGRSAMLAAAEQGKGFDFAQILYDNQRTENTGWLSQNMVEQAAESIPGMNVQKLVSDESSAAVAQQAKHFDTLEARDKVTQTPTLYVQSPGSKQQLVNITSPTDSATLFAALDSALGK
jgi:protein-disulfide isomerase